MALPLAATLVACTTDRSSIATASRSTNRSLPPRDSSALQREQQQTTAATATWPQTDWIGTAPDAMATCRRRLEASCKNCTQSMSAATAMHRGVRGHPGSGVQRRACDRATDRASNTSAIRGARKRAVRQRNMADPTRAAPRATPARITRSSSNGNSPPLRRARRSPTTTPPAGLPRRQDCAAATLRQDPISRQDHSRALAVTCTVCQIPMPTGTPASWTVGCQSRSRAIGMSSPAEHRAGRRNARGNARHAPQGAAGGYRRLSPRRICGSQGRGVSTHGSSANPRLCAGCT